MADQETKETNHSGESLNSAITHILNKLEIIDREYSVFRQRENFNIFSILREGTEEVELHSRFIAELLNPKGSHGMGGAFLQLFIKEVVAKACEKEEEIQALLKSTASAVVSVEKSFTSPNGEKKDGGRVDLIIENIGKNEIIIENKIYARDQPGQLWRYRNRYPNAYIFYLTLHGHKPSAESLGGLDGSSIVNISYRAKEEVSRWLERCVEKSATRPTLRESIVQYKNLIGRLTGETVMAEESEEVLNVLREGANAKWASKIVENWNHLRWHTEWDYWIKLEERANKDKEDAKFSISTQSKFSADKLDKVIHRARNGDPWYGLRFDVAQYKDKPVFVGVERGEGNVILGIPEKDEVRRKELAAYFPDRNQNDYWVCRTNLNPAINFESFANMGGGLRTLDLCNPTKREEIVEAHWQQIKKFIDEVRAKLGANA